MKRLCIYFMKCRALLKDYLFYGRGEEGKIVIPPLGRGEEGRMVIAPLGRGEEGRMVIPPLGRGEEGRIVIPPFWVATPEYDIAKFTVITRHTVIMTERKRFKLIELFSELTIRVPIIIDEKMN